MQCTHAHAHTHAHTHAHAHTHTAHTQRTNFTSCGNASCARSKSRLQRRAYTALPGLASLVILARLDSELALSASWSKALADCTPSSVSTKSSLARCKPSRDLKTRTTRGFSGSSDSRQLRIMVAVTSARKFPRMTFVAWDTPQHRNVRVTTAGNASMIPATQPRMHVDTQPAGAGHVRSKHRAIARADPSQLYRPLCGRW